MPTLREAEERLAEALMAYRAATNPSEKQYQWNRLRIAQAEFEAAVAEIRARAYVPGPVPQCVFATIGQ